MLAAYHALYGAARALFDNTKLSAHEIVDKAMHIAADICIYTNHSVTVERLPAAMKA